MKFPYSLTFLFPYSLSRLATRHSPFGDNDVVLVYFW